MDMECSWGWQVVDIMGLERIVSHFGGLWQIARDEMKDGTGKEPAGNTGGDIAQEWVKWP